MSTSKNSISHFKSNFNGGTRANRFEVALVDGWPGISSKDVDTTFKITAASFPTVTINPMTIPYRGRAVNYAGDRQYSPWNITIYDDANPDGLWSAFNSWKELLDGHVTHETEDPSYESLQRTWDIYQYDNNGYILRQIELYNCWPLSIGEINLNMSSQDMVTFNVTLQFDRIDYIEGI